ncbi:hypothetical protein J3U51_04240 [Gilliamella sp. B3781]|nr:hypothetical protein [Gilliamella sp. B3835]MCX8708272.1 hypothetical protein [Gilliamella sp. B3783]MCX8709437.1 hypothetical protein [Gilliamella sp. B3780]MCX8714213.1 hypothetical protein [Gilliamella sp. B3781]MCX8717543.1 hypothetical protein [Gilliamella sp. B3784]MCX8719803.1 hypothetical protein [Gilliamella sp. B3788]MCX8727495.1 hypothetical protein [Gilliamella sp. B2838]MCX8742089.1 hypothetical protein [Gilliamella sp. B3791]
MRICDAIIAHFPLNLELKKDNFALYINFVPSAYPTITDKTTYTIPVSMNYLADTLM